jgi:predicted small lipoprotein YifL
MIRILALLAMFLALGACGQKGPLKLPDAPPPPAAPAK